MAWAVGGGEPLEHRRSLGHDPLPPSSPQPFLLGGIPVASASLGPGWPRGQQMLCPPPRALPPLTGSQPPFPQPSSQEASSPAAARLPSPFRASSCSLTAGSEQDTRWPCWPTHRPVVQMSLTSDSEHPSQLWAGCCCSQAPPGTRSPCLLVSPTVRCQPLPFTSP